MKKLLLAVLISVFFIFGCSQQTDLPPEPGAPGGATGIGEAILGLWGADPTGYFDIDPYNLIFMGEAESSNMDASAYNDDYVWKYGYYYKPATKEWVSYKFVEETVGSSDWIKDDATSVVNILSGLPEGENYIIAYGCTKDSSYPNGWNCHPTEDYKDGDWMVRIFNVEYKPNIDLKVDDISFDNNEVGVETKISAIIKNVGETTVNAGDFTVLIDYGDLSEDSVPYVSETDLQPGASYIANFEHIWSSEGTYDVKAEVGVEDDINPADNTWMKEHQVGYDLPPEPGSPGHRG